ncbi:CsbD family protein [Peredibacter starrii]|uniref:CsbD family protein n=1 Tax=Peredibacter starrii TaxID=28202 RepID=A0AAX4HRL6_9BACT|nr:CsbD family protein [Peredibacter starrii]WPU65872.1 CsbD family protein [Peredibacter starrii]
MNEDILKGKWNEIKGEIRSRWGKLNDDELEGMRGNFTSIGGLLQQRYGLKQDEARDGLNKILSRFNSRVEDFKDDLRDDNSAHP